MGELSDTIMGMGSIKISTNVNDGETTSDSYSK